MNYMNTMYNVKVAVVLGNTFNYIIMLPKSETMWWMTGEWSGCATWERDTTIQFTLFLSTIFPSQLTPQQTTLFY